MDAITASHVDLVSRARSGDKDAYEAILRPSLSAALRLARALVGNPADAEDVVQEATLKAWRKFGNLRPGSDFEPWFLGIVVREARTVQRGRWWSLVRLPDLARPAKGVEADWLEGEDLREAILRLPRKQREAILLHFYLDLSIEASARAMRVSPAGVKSNVNRALRHLRKEMR
jgi:RNA polymerase sigma factor (sigma-70 family)